MTSQLMSAFLIIDVNFQYEQTKFPYKYLFKNYIPLKKNHKKVSWMVKLSNLERNVYS